MQVTDDQILENFAEQTLHSTRNGPIPFENGWSCISCEYNKIKQQN